MDNIELLEDANEFLDEMSLGGFGKAAMGAGRAMTRGAAGGLGSIGSMAGRAGKAIAGGVRGMAGNAGAMAQKAGGASMRAPMRPGVTGGGARSAMRPGGLGRSLTSDIETPLERANRFLHEVSMNPIKAVKKVKATRLKIDNTIDKVGSAPQRFARAVGGY